MDYETAATPTIMPLSFGSEAPEGVFPSNDAVAENVGVRTFTSRTEEGGRGIRQSDFEGVMGIFGSKTKDI